LARGGVSGTNNWGRAMKELKEEDNCGGGGIVQKKASEGEKGKEKVYATHLRSGIGNNIKKGGAIPTSGGKIKSQL